LLLLKSIYNKLILKEVLIIMSNSTKIRPIPQYLNKTNEFLKLGCLGAPHFRVSSKKLNSELSQNALSALLDGLSSVIGVDSEKFFGDIEISLEISDKIPDEVTKNQNQAYKIEITDSKVSLVGFGDLGAYYAVTSFLNALTVENNSLIVEKMSVIDFPDLKTRGHFIESRFGSNLMTLDDWKSVVDDMVSKKMNQLVVALYGCWCIQYDGIVSNYVYINIPKYPKLKYDVINKYYSPKRNRWINETVEVPMAKEDFFGELIKYGKAHGVEVLPLWNSYGHNTLVPSVYPETAPIQEDGTPGKVAFCTTSEKTKQLLFDIYDHIIDTYLKPNGIESFHIGLDEVRNEIGVDVNDPYRVYSPWCQCEKCKQLSNEDKVFNHAITLIGHLKSRGMKNIYLYSDVIAEKLDLGRFKKMLKENDLLDVTVFDWWTYRNRKEHIRFQSLKPEFNLRSVVKPMNSYTHWTGCRDYIANSYFLMELAMRDGAEGLQSYSAWDKTCDINHAAMSEFSWNFAATGGIQDFREKYARDEFGAQYEKAITALELFHKLSDAYPKATPKEIAKSCFGVLLKDYCTYYGYSYVRAGLDYPRNFPGDAINAMLTNAPYFPQGLKKAEKIANKGYKLFDEISKDVTCNTQLAHRYAVELRAYRDLARDYLAFLEMNRLLEDKDENAQSKIYALAKERKTEKLALMLEMEGYKEDYLIPSHLRNLTIIMQVFADIEAYANTAKPEEFNLDMRDLRPIASKIFYEIR